jgi:hypothetical protein
MKITGKQIIDAIAKRLAEENVRCYDSAIVAKLSALDSAEINQLSSFGDVTAWHNERMQKEETP